MDSIVRTFTWCLSDVNLWSSLDIYSVRSPTCSSGNSQFQFYLQFTYDKQANQIKVLVLRCPDGGLTTVETLISLALKTVSGRVLHSSTCRASFPVGGLEGFTFSGSKSYLQDCLKEEEEKDMIIVSCVSTLLEPTFTFLNEDVKDLSADLLKLRNDSLSANACLIASGQSIPVHKEILCARSPVFKEKLKDNDYSDKKFPVPVMNAVLDYIYSSTFSLKELSACDIEQLSPCALHYGIEDLAKLLVPRRTCVTSLVHSKTENHTLQFPNFAELCKSHHSVEHHRIKMQFNEAIEMSVKILFEPYDKCGNIVLETTFWNLVNVKSLFVRLLMPDKFNALKTVQENPLEINDEEKLKFCMEFGSESLFSGRNSILSNNILTLQYEIKFQFSGELHISDPNPCNRSEGRVIGHEASLALVKSMESLIESKFGADAFLVLPPTQRDVPKTSMISVHKNILSVRSPVFKDMFGSSQKVPVNLSESVVKYLLYYVYAGVLLADKPRILDALHEAAGIYSMNSLKRACEKAATKMTLDTKNVISVCMIAVRGKLYKLQELCEDFILRNKDLVICSRGWEKLRKYKTASNEMRRDILST